MKQTVKKTISMILALLLFVSLFGCGKSNKDESSAETTPSVESTPAAEPTPSAQNLEPTDADLEHFQDVLGAIVSFRYGMLIDADYDPQAPGATTYALECVFNIWFPLYDMFAEAYGWPAAEIIWDSEYDAANERYVFETPDPLKLVNSYYYGKFPGEKVDWLLENVMGIAPDHTYNSFEQDLSEHEGWFECYYYDGDYYYGFGDGGDAGHQIRIDSQSSDGNGIYTFDISALVYDSETVDGRYTVKAQLHEADGHREWKLLKIETK
ncbi:MAG: hypothetical protein IKN72_11590 [Clostridia bacterium]|nr:hypothetical protein [Clostridia bacterium]